MSTLCTISSFIRSSHLEIKILKIFCNNFQCTYWLLIFLNIHQIFTYHINVHCTCIVRFVNHMYLLQVFVANPNKPKPILDILLRNKDKLVDFLTKFHTERSDDEQFNDEKAYLIKQIKELKADETSTS